MSPSKRAPRGADDWGFPPRPPVGRAPLPASYKAARAASMAASAPPRPPTPSSLSAAPPRAGRHRRSRSLMVHSVRPRRLGATGAAGRSWSTPFGHGGWAPPAQPVAHGPLRSATEAGRHRRSRSLMVHSVRPRRPGATGAAGRSWSTPFGHGGRAPPAQPVAHGPLRSATEAGRHRRSRSLMVHSVRPRRPGATGAAGRSWSTPFGHGGRAPPAQPVAHGPLRSATEAGR